MLKTANCKLLFTCNTVFFYRIASWGSISTTFYEQLFLYKIVSLSFLVLTVWVCNFCQKEIIAKAACELLLKLTPGLMSVFSFPEMNLSTFASKSDRGWLYSWLMHNPEVENLTVLKEGRYLVSYFTNNFTLSTAPKS